MKEELDKSGKIQRMCDLSYVGGMLESLQDLPRGRRVMAWYAFQCNHPEQVPDSDLATYAKEYNRALERQVYEVDKEQREIWEEVKDIDPDLLSHLNTLYCSLGYSETFKDALERFLFLLQGAFIDMGADRQELTRGFALSIFSNIERQLNDYDTLIKDLRKDAEIKLKKALGAVNE